MVRGRARIVEDPEEKAFALQALMAKLQPEGGHVPITADQPLYAAALRQGTAVVAIEIESMTGKFKVGQNLNGNRRESVEQGLQERGCPIDHETLEAMKRSR